VSLLDLFKTDLLKAAAYPMYREAGEKARRESFFTELEVVDDFDGRFDLLVLHVHLLIRRLRLLPENGKKAQQHLFDVFIGDLDQGLRMSGVGDIGIGHRVKKMTHAYYGRAVAYDEALDEADRGKMESGLRRNLYRERSVNAENVTIVAAYFEAQEERLKAMTDETVLSGEGLFDELEGLAP
jgi:cytochrome b pre-mRNA-processing protein 3